MGKSVAESTVWTRWDRLKIASKSDTVYSACELYENCDHAEYIDIWMQRGDKSSPEEYNTRAHVYSVWSDY